jgi:hypothetical protein
MRLRIAEVNQHAVAHVFRHEPAKATHGLGNARLIGRNDLAQILRVHTGGECRRADKVREHHGDLAALGGIARLHGNRHRAGRSGDGSVRAGLELIAAGTVFSRPSEFAIARNSLRR